MKTTWDLSLLLVSDADPTIKIFLAKCETEAQKFVKKWEPRTDYLSEPKILKGALSEFEKWVTTYAMGGKVGFYFSLKGSLDKNDPNIKAMNNKIAEQSVRIENEMQFFMHRVSTMPKKDQKRFLAYADLKEYKHFLEKSFAEAKYLLTEPEEKVVNLMAKTSFSNWRAMLSALLAKEEIVVLTEQDKQTKVPFSQAPNLLVSKNKKVRDSVAQEINRVLEKQSDVAEHELNSLLEAKKVADDMRKISRPDLGRHISDDIESKVVDVMLQTVADHFSISKRYYKLKAQLLGVPKLEYHDRSAEYGTVNTRYDFAKACTLARETFYDLDQDFGKIFDTYVANGHIDVYSKKGKSGGAFCTTWLRDHPTYILLNYSNKLNDVLTLAHEVGHGINTELIKVQSELNYMTPLSTAEVASTFMEDFVLERVLREADDETKLAIMMMRMDDNVATILRQVACYKFEQELHATFRQAGYLSKTQIGKLFQKHMKAYMGSYVNHPPESQNWWIYWSHIRSFFYVYSYASGLLISKALQNKVKQDPKFILAVKDFLAAGGSESPKTSFRKLGIDITDKNFWVTGLAEVETLLQDTQKLAKKLGKI